MRRDDPALAAPQAALERHAIAFGDGLFGWYHDDATAAPRDCVAVICPPIGPDYTRSHRTLRHLADRLAAAGVPALRFDPHGVGDSSGEGDGPDRIDRWRRDVAAAAREARRLSGRARLCLIGLRLGGTLAALESADAEADMLVLWNPVVKGRTWARELQAMAMTAGSPPAADDDGIEAGGFRATRELMDALPALDLARTALLPGTRVLLLERDDLAGDRALADALARAGVTHERIAASGWNGMMADHQFTVVPEVALATARDWILANSREGPWPRVAAAALPSEPIRFDGFEESAQRFGAGEKLSGVLSRPATPLGKPAVVLLNAGSIHHVGPHRLYVRLARTLARRGHVVLRFDLEGIGDSVLRGPGRENHPYVAGAMPDVAAALDHLRRSQGCERFILVGLCSGAYHAFRAGLELREAPIERLVAINPWYFEWREGLSLDTSVNHYESVAAYRSAARDPERWKKLLRGEVDLARLARVGWAHVAKTLRGRWQDAREAIAPGTGTRLSQDLHALAALRRPLHLIASDGEPAQTILETEAARATRRLQRAGLLHIERVRGGDHTFSRAAPRAELVERILRIVDTPGSRP